MNSRIFSGSANVPLIEGDDQIRVRKCAQKIENALKQFDCFMRPEITIEGTKIIPKVQIMAKSRNPKTILPS